MSHESGRSLTQCPSESVLAPGVTEFPKPWRLLRVRGHDQAGPRGKPGPRSSGLTDQEDPCRPQSCWLPGHWLVRVSRKGVLFSVVSLGVEAAGSALRAPSSGSQLEGGEEGGRRRTAERGRDISPDQGLGPVQVSRRRGCNMCPDPGVRGGPQTGAQCSPTEPKSERMRAATVAMHPHPIIYTLPSASSPAPQPQSCWPALVTPSAGVRSGGPRGATAVRETCEGLSWLQVGVAFPCRLSGFFDWMAF